LTTGDPLASLTSFSLQAGARDVNLAAPIPHYCFVNQAATVARAGVKSTFQFDLDGVNDNFCPYAYHVSLLLGLNEWVDFDQVCQSRIPAGNFFVFFRV
jgi:hypothetical protein